MMKWNTYTKLTRYANVMGKFQLPPEPHRGCKTWPPHTSWLFWPFWLLRLININTPTYLLSDEFLVDKKYVLSNSESVQCNFFIFDHVTFIQFKICCCVQNFMKIRWFFTEIWRYIDFQNGGRPPSWNCFTIIETIREVSVAGRSYMSNFMSIWCTDLKI